MIVTDLETVNPAGRVDVLAYRGVQKLAQHIEQQYGLSGIWDAVKPHVNEAINKHVGQMDIPTEAKVLLSILQSNYKVKE
jgi:hypothetical protein